MQWLIKTMSKNPIENMLPNMFVYITNSDLYISLMKLNEICEVYSGYAIKEFNNNKNGLPVIKIGNIISDGTLNLGECQFSTEDINEKYHSKKGDIYIALSGATTGKLGIMEDEKNYIINQRVGVIRLKQKNFSQNYIKYFLLKQTGRITDEATGCAQPNISPKQIGEYDVPVFPEKEMLQICNILNNIECVIKHYKAMLEKYDDLIKARFVEMFGHQNCNEKQLPYLTIDDVAEIYLGITHTPTYVDSGVIFISAKNTSKDFLDLSDVKYISREEFIKSPKGSRPQKNDVLFSRVGSNLGHPVILEKELELCTFVSLGFLRTKGNVTSNYLKHWMRDEFFTKQVLEHVKGGGQPNLNTGWLKEFKIIVPNIEEQVVFDIFCQQVDKSKFI